MMSKAFQKSITAVYVALAIAGPIFVFELFLLWTNEESNDVIILSLVVGGFVLIGSLIIGVPVSLFSDLATKKAGCYRFILAGLIHIVFAGLTVFMIGWYAFFSLVAAFLFFLIDEWRSRGKGLKWLPIKRAGLVNAIVLLFVTAISSSGIYVFADKEVEEEKTHQMYMIPEGYEGKVQIVHEVKGVPDPKTSEGYTVVEINGLGYGTTPEPFKEGIIEDKYFYVSKDGKKTAIDETCISIGGTEGTQVGDYEYEATTFFVTKTFCGKRFQEGEGETFYSESMELFEILVREGLINEGEY